MSGPGSSGEPEALPITESPHPDSEAIDRLDAAGIVSLMNREDERVVAAVREVAGPIAVAVEWAADALRDGGRLIYVGAGTSGRLGVLDASECPPTFGTEPEQVVGLIAGGPSALTRAIEGAEDRPEEGRSDIVRHRVNSADLVIGIATSGRTPYVLGAIAEARSRGARTVGIACNRPSDLGRLVDLEIAPIVGPEVIAGSTRLKAGTATKMILNTLSTGAMVLLGKTYGNRMIDLLPTNEKLRRRSRRILRELAGVSEQEAADILAVTADRLKPALVIAMGGVDLTRAEALLREAGGRLRPALDAARGGDRP